LIQSYDMPIGAALGLRGEIIKEMQVRSRCHSWSPRRARELRANSCIHSSLIGDTIWLGRSV
jgi:hypothetical protein